MRLRRLAVGLTLFVQGLDTAAWEGRGIADLLLAWRDVLSNVPRCFNMVSLDCLCLASENFKDASAAFMMEQMAKKENERMSKAEVQGLKHELQMCQ